MVGALNLDTMVAEYGEHDAQAKHWKKVCDGEKETLKNAFIELDTKSHSSGGYKVELRESHKTSWDEDKMVETIKKHWSSKNGSMTCPYLKMVYVLDSDALENAIYKGEVPNDLLLALDECKTTITTHSLYCGKAKSKEE